MSSPGVERKLMAILYADAAGYSRLTGEDEEGTYQTLREYLDAISRVVNEAGGRVVHYAGDAVLAVFSSVVAAVTCAVDVQGDLAARNESLPEARRIRFRIGINLGDVIVDREDIYGDGVNVAARLEGLAEPGGICVSGEVYRQAAGKVDVGFEDLGDRQVKNIAKPVRVYRVRPDVETVGSSTGAAAPASQRRFWALAMLIAAVAGAGVVGAFYLRVQAPPEDMASGAHADAPVLTGPSLAVMPFTNVSGDPQQEYFADGITEDLITDLSKFTGLFVIARNTMFVYKGRAVTAQEVADDLGVRYVLEGGIRREGKKVRINVRLADTATETLLWAERYDGSLTEVFSLQDDITRKIVAALAVELPKRAESLRSRAETASPEAYDAFLVGRALYRRKTPEDLAKSVSFFEQAVALDPGFGRAHAALAAVYSESRVRGWEQSLGLTAEECWRRAEEHLSAAKQNPTALAHQVAASMLSFQGRHEEAIAQAGRAIALDASDPAGYQAMAKAQKAAGNVLEGAFR